MAALTSLSQLVNLNSGGNSGTPESIFMHKRPRVSGTNDSWTAGLLYDTWRYDQVPVPGVTPSAVAVPTNTTVGAIPITNSSGGREKWLVGANMVLGDAPSSIGSFLLYDRLLHKGGLSGTSTSVQNVQSGSGVSLTRNTGGVGNQIWVQVWTAIGTTPQTLTVTYTNSAGTGSRTTTTTLGGTGNTQFNEANSAIRVPLASGDLGVRSVESVQLGGSTGTAGDFGITIAKPIRMLSKRPDQLAEGLSGLALIPTDACLGILIFVNSTTISSIAGQFSFVEA